MVDLCNANSCYPNVLFRFRCPGWITLESNYRFPISRNGLSGGVVFASATTASREAIMIVDTNFEQQNLAEANRLASGFGARLMLNRTGRFNLAVDRAFGQHSVVGFKLTVDVTFRVICACFPQADKVHFYCSGQSLPCTCR